MLRPPSVNLAQQAPGRPTTTTFPGSLSDLVASFETVKQKGGPQAFPTVQFIQSSVAPHRMNNLGEVHKLLEGGYTHVPQPIDTEK